MAVVLGIHSASYSSVVVVRLAVVFVLAGCSSSRDGAAPAPVAHRDAAPVLSFRRDIAPVLDKHCTAKDCHGDRPAIDVSLDLRPAAAYRQLVNVPAEMGETHLMRIRPGDPDASMIVHKLAGRIGFKEGKRMPIDGDTGEPIVPSPLPVQFVDDVVVPWIQAGALDD
jgi:hypothetical protein